MHVLLPSLACLESHAWICIHNLLDKWDKQCISLHYLFPNCMEHNNYVTIGNSSIEEAMYNPHVHVSPPKVPQWLLMYMYIGVPGDMLGLVVVCAFSPFMYKFNEYFVSVKLRVSRIYTGYILSEYIYYMYVLFPYLACSESHAWIYIHNLWDK